MHEADWHHTGDSIQIHRHLEGRLLRKASIFVARNESKPVNEKTSTVKLKVFPGGPQLHRRSLLTPSQSLNSPSDKNGSPSLP